MSVITHQPLLNHAVVSGLGDVPFGHVCRAWKKQLNCSVPSQEMQLKPATTVVSMPRITMVCRIILLSSVVVLTLCAACANSQNQEQKQIAKANELTEQYFDQIAAGDAHADAQLGLSEAHIYGRSQFILFNIWIANGPADIKKTAEAPVIMNSTITFWVQAMQNGQAVNLSRTAKLTIQGSDDDAKWQTQNIVFVDTPLTFWDRAGQWLLWCFLGPILIFLYLCIYGGFENANAAYFLARWGGLPWVGYVSFVCFGSILTIVIGLAVYSLIIWVLLGILGSVVTGLNSYRTAI